MDKKRMEPEYAEQYSFKERLRFALIGLTAGAVVMLVWNQWALPLWSEFVEQSPCIELWGISGVAVVFYTLFVGFPLLFALVTAFFASRRGVRILRDKQFPPQGEKVFHPTRIRRGRRAILLGWAHVMSPALFLAMAVWGAPQAAAIVDRISADGIDQSMCEPYTLGQWNPY